MLITDRKLRIYGLVSFALIFFLFFHAFMFYYQSEDHVVLIGKSVLVSVFFAVTIWEPTRWLILTTRARWNNEGQNIKRKLILISFLLPYAIFVGFIRTILEDQFLWELPWKEPSFSVPMVGINMLFILAEVALYESLFFVDKWHRSEMEAKELKKINLQIQYDSLKVQIQPHFLFNTLNTLIGLMKMDVPKAINFTEEMAYVYRYLLEANERPLISLSEEIRFTKAYFFLLKTRYSEGLHFDVEGILDDEAMENFTLPPLSLQLLIENSVKHNIITREKPLSIKIKIEPYFQQLIVSNNLQKKAMQINSTGLGLAHLQRKFEMLHLPPVMIDVTKEHFTVILPLLNSPVYESGNH